MSSPLTNIKLGSQYNDRVFWRILVGLAVMSAVFFFSASRSLIITQGSVMSPLLKHIFFLCLGLGLAWFIQYFPSNWIRPIGYLGLAMSFAFQLLLLAGKGVRINGAMRWISIAGITFQPSELTKLCIVIVCGDLLSRIHSEQDQKRYFWITTAIVGVFCAMILPTNLSTVILIFALYTAMLFLANIPRKWLFGMLVVVVTIAITAFLIADYGFVRRHKPVPLFPRAVTWVNRIHRFTSNDSAQTASSTTVQKQQEDTQATMAKIAVARGKLSILGATPGGSKQKKRLPYAYADFIFAIIVEEWGFVGVFVLVAAYMWTLYRACTTSNRYDDFSAMYIVMGLAIMLTLQAFVSMAVSVSLGPVTGQPLPLISHGGTSALITCCYYGIMMAVSREQNALKAKEENTKRQSAEDVPEIQIN
ncbi:MAG: FtsW/RodA/SpoVE family cell cycle protein [Paludibacteraceae bacterium]|nr:FtsW/RodA/SpoVE family cell cycle protein [Paludibacteraceae bacterium]